jgi:hypothetical protein
MQRSGTKIWITVAITIVLAIIMTIACWDAIHSLVKGISGKALANRCIRLLSVSDYDGALEVYHSAGDDPIVKANIDQSLAKRARTLLEQDDFSSTLELSKTFREEESAREAILRQIGICAEEAWKDYRIDYIVLQQNLAYEGLYVDALDQLIFDLVCSDIARQDYTNPDSYYRLLSHNGPLMAQMHVFLNETLSDYLASDNWESISLLYSFLSYVDGEVESISRTIYDQGCLLMEQSRYEEAEYVLHILDYDPFVKNESYFALLQLRLRELLQEGRYDDAKILVGGYTDERREILLAIYREYCGENP